LYLKHNPASPESLPPIAAVQPVTDEYFGIKVIDPYRYMENLDDSGVQKWLKAQADYTRSQLDRIPGRPAVLADRKKYDDSAPALVGGVTRTIGGRTIDRSFVTACRSWDRSRRNWNWSRIATCICTLWANRRMARGNHSRSV
jgi:hypothetical protein